VAQYHLAESLSRWQGWVVPARNLPGLQRPQGADGVLAKVGLARLSGHIFCATTDLQSSLEMRQGNLLSLKEALYIAPWIDEHHSFTILCKPVYIHGSTIFCNRTRREAWRSGKSVSLWSWVHRFKVLKTVSCKNIRKYCIHKIQSAQIIPCKWTKG
jgi:hypothetical protein